MKTIYIANDDMAFTDEESCRQYEAELMRKVEIPVKLLAEAIAQCTPYLMTAKERRELKSRLEKYLPPEKESEQNDQAHPTAAEKGH